MKKKIVLGSGSAPRKKILADMGYDFSVISADIDEKAIRHEDPTALTMAIALAKAKAILPEMTEDAVLITVDEVAFCNGEIYEKPKDAEEARRYLRNYKDYPVLTYTSVIVTDFGTGEMRSGTDIATTHFSEFPDDVIAALIKEGEIMWAAGAFIIEHPMMSKFIKKIEGEPESVMGLPVALTKRLLAELGV